ncbi:hypothetical protein GRI89_12205 [Altererythrobacter salegens]|uniref:Uncharacterized protein n=1 Tax=Croceibacterium salegens TaxID=1737568 RepID=A0A6I4SWC1_9SPHN|nr:hypothetical protein [Croceibacterium salegens]MXO60301.1 hypothetical protein [Croceibacterium salegens]
METCSDWTDSTKNIDFDLGVHGEGGKSTPNIQPVIPISIGEDWNMISRTIVPII